MLRSWHQFSQNFKPLCFRVVRCHRNLDVAWLKALKLGFSLLKRRSEVTIRRRKCISCTMGLRLIGNGDGSVVIATALRNRRSGNQISVQARDFSILQNVQTTQAQFAKWLLIYGGSLKNVHYLPHSNKIHYQQIAEQISLINT